MPRIELGNMTVPTSIVAKNIGVFLDDAIATKNHVQHMCRVAYFHIHCIGQTRHFLDRKTTDIMVNAYVTSRLGQGNGLLYGVSDHASVKSTPDRAKLRSPSRDTDKETGTHHA